MDRIKEICAGATLWFTTVRKLFVTLRFNDIHDLNLFIVLFIDHVKCFANPKLWPEIAACGTELVNGFVRDPTFNPSINNPSSTQDVGGTVLLQLQSRNVQAFSP